MDTIREIFNNLGDDQVLVIYLDDDCKAVMDSRDKVESVFGLEFALIKCGKDEKIPVPVELITKVEVMSKLDFFLNSITEEIEKKP